MKLMPLRREVIEFMVLSNQKLNGQDPPNQSGPGSKQGSQSTTIRDYFPLQSPALNMDIPIHAAPYMLAHAFVHTGVTEGLTRLGMDGRDADQLAQLASLAFGSKNFGKVAGKGEKNYLSLAEVRAGIWQNQVEPYLFKY